MTREHLAARIIRSRRTDGECLFHVGHGVRGVAALVAIRFPVAGGIVSFHGPVLGRSLRRLRRASLADASTDFVAAHAAGIFLRLAADFYSRLRVISNFRPGGIAE